MEQRLDSLRKSLEKREVGLLRALSQGQMVMMSIGSAIGTGLFLGSGYAISLAGPGVALSFVLGAFISYTVGSALSELTRVIPTTGAFGNHAEVFIGRYLGFLVRYMYWFSEVFAIGANIAASSIYMSYWFPGVSPILWMIAFGLSLFVLNSLTVRTLGTAEFLLSMIKSAMIVLFIVAGSYIILRPEHFGTSSALLNDGLMPKGVPGIWLATVVAIYSFIGIEVVGVTSGEAKNPEKDAPKALRNTLVLLTLLYVGAIIIIVSMIPPNMAGLSESSFVLAFREVGIPAAASIINFVILTAAISGANTNLYLTSRMLFSLARGGMAPKKLEALNKFKAPFNALLASMIGVAAATVLAYGFGSSSSYLIAFGIATFGGIFTWASILASHIAYSLKFNKGRFPLLSFIGEALLLSALATTAITPGLEVTIPSGIATIFVLSLLYKHSKNSSHR